jgi:hypothetical protein
MTREEVKEVIFVIGNEYKDFIPESEERIKKKIDTWYHSLKSFEAKFVQIKTIELLHKHTFGTPSIAHLMQLLAPGMEKQNAGQEYADRFVELLRKLGSGGMESAIYQEYGDIGKEIYLQNKDIARLILEKDILIFKAQIRESFNSKLERREKGLEIAENKNKFLIESKLKAIEVI